MGMVSRASVPDKVFVVNEGAFGNNNASLTILEPNTGQLTQQAFFSANGYYLGDIANDAQWINDRLYIVVNNSHKIEVVDPETHESVQTIQIQSDQHGGSPRRIAAVHSQKAYVTNLYGDNVSIIDLDAGIETGTIELGAGSAPEDIVIAGTYAFIALSELGNGNRVAVIDTDLDEMVKEIEVGDNPTWMAKAPDGMVWSVATGDYGYDENWQYDPERETFGEIVVIDPDHLEVTDRIFVGGHPGRVHFLDDQYALIQKNGVRKINLATRTTYEEPWIDRSIYSFGVDQTQEEPAVYVMIAPDFASSGSVVQYDRHAVAVDSFQAGVGPSNIAFWRQTNTQTRAGIEAPLAFDLRQNYPNPFNPVTTIAFQIQEPSHVQLEIFDTAGRRIYNKVIGQAEQGVHTITWDGSSFSSGVYVYKLTANGHSRIKKMMLVK
ncbi:T9SS type A sorting domain-containing protein [Balneolaceae bacterium ANBcel3]|nr:T9SS type A sorting domain-containing protein [Balneolaceae bacterium ANBcel3]